METDKEPELCRLHVLKVVRMDRRGIWLEAGDRTAHLPQREAPETRPGDEVEVFLYQDPTGDLQATTRHPLAQAGEFALLTVRSTGPHGAFLDWGLAKDLLAPFALQPERMQAGKSYLVRVEMDHQGRPYANARIEDCLDQGRPDLKEGASVTLLVRQLTDLGAKVIVNHRYPGMLYRDEVPPGADVGVPLAGYVKRIREDGKLDVTLRRVGTEGASEAREAVLRALQDHGGSFPLHDNSSPEEIKHLLGMSKKSFKKAVGGLYKEGLVELTAAGVKLRKASDGRKYLSG